LYRKEAVMTCGICGSPEARDYWAMGKTAPLTGSDSYVQAILHFKKHTPERPTQSTIIAPDGNEVSPARPHVDLCENCFLMAGRDVMMLLATQIADRAAEWDKAGRILSGLPPKPALN
jgi:hypothetical protein